MGLMIDINQVRSDPAIAKVVQADLDVPVARMELDRHHVGDLFKPVTANV